MNANKQDAGGLPEFPEPAFLTQIGNEAYSADQMHALREEAFKAGMKFCRDNFHDGEQCRAASGVDALIADWRDSAKYSGHSADEKNVYLECAEALEKLRALSRGVPEGK